MPPDGEKWLPTTPNMAPKFGSANMSTITLCMLGVTTNRLLAPVRRPTSVWQNLDPLRPQKLTEAHSLVTRPFGKTCPRKLTNLVGIGMLITKQEWANEKTTDMLVLLATSVLTRTFWFLWRSSGTISGYRLLWAQTCLIRQVFPPWQSIEENSLIDSLGLPYI